MIVNYSNRGNITRGVVVGKFAPPHLGHHYLINEAAMRCDQLTIVVVNTPVPGFNVNIEQRALWLAEIHPGATVKIIPDILFDNRSDLWAEYTEAFLGYIPDVVFSSESYGQSWAEAMGCRSITVDKARTVVPISATRIREATTENLEYLHPVVRAAFVKRVAIVGAESTGTTTLSKSLAKHYNTVWVPEFGRLRDERGNPEWSSEEFPFVAIAQQTMEDRLARDANPVLICDTDALATALWHERYHGTLDPATMHIAESRTYSLYIVTDWYGVPAVDDGFRFEMFKRPSMHNRFIEELNRLNRPHIVVTGSHEQRMAQATEAIEATLYDKVDTRV